MMTHRKNTTVENAGVSPAKYAALLAGQFRGDRASRLCLALGAVEIERVVVTPTRPSWIGGERFLTAVAEVLRCRLEDATAAYPMLRGR